MDFDIIAELKNVETLAAGRGIRDLSRLHRQYGQGRWRGFTTVRLKDDTIHTAEDHWYEAHGMGRKEFKLKFPLVD